jgi:hypothetical protein
MKFKKICIYALVAFLVGCETMQLAPRPKTIHGRECIASPYLRVMQVGDKGVLGHICPTSYPSYDSNAFDSCIFNGDAIFMEVLKTQNNFVDNQKITLEKNQCFVGNGTYAYTSADGQRRTVRSIVILQENANPAGNNQNPSK